MVCGTTPRHWISGITVRQCAWVKMIGEATSRNSLNDGLACECMRRGLLEGGDCTYASMPLQTGNPAGEVYGADSYCLTGTLLKNM
jgi:hypothetical protein